RCPRIHPDVHSFIEREADGDGTLDLPPRDLLAVHGERPGPAFAIAAAVVFEVDLESVLAGREFFAGGDAVFMLLLVRERVVELRFAVHQKQGEATEASALGNEHSLRAGVRNLDIGRDRERPVLRVGRGTLGNANGPWVIGERVAPASEAGSNRDISALSK